MSRTYGTCNSTIRFSKFTSNKKNMKRVWWVCRFWREILSVIYYLDRYLSHSLWIGTPLKHPLRHLRQFFLLGFCSFFKEFHLFFFFWKQINCFQIMCFRKCGDPWTPANSFYQVHLECTCVPKNCFKIKVFFFFLDRFFLLKHYIWIFLILFWIFWIPIILFSHKSSVL